MICTLKPPVPNNAITYSCRYSRIGTKQRTQVLHKGGDGSDKDYSLDYYTGVRVQTQGAVHPCPLGLCTQFHILAIMFEPAGKGSHVLYLVHIPRRLKSKAQEHHTITERAL
jgi:hypothetical protein